MIDEPNNNSSAIDTQEAFRELRLFTVGSVQFGIFEDEIAAIAEWRDPVPLPHAPESVIGVVGIHGRMLTVLDLARINVRDPVTEKLCDPNGQRQILALRGDEQLALAVDALGEKVDIPEHALKNKSETRRLVFGAFTHGETEIRVINVKELFPNAIHGRERRRRRF
ncbi:MAG: chemotaxis protein CheW [Acidobacteriota bacterium]